MNETKIDMTSEIDDVFDDAPLSNALEDSDVSEVSEASDVEEVEEIEEVEDVVHPLANVGGEDEEDVVEDQEPAEDATEEKIEEEVVDLVEECEEECEELSEEGESFIQQNERLSLDDSVKYIHNWLIELFEKMAIENVTIELDVDHDTATLNISVFSVPAGSQQLLSVLKTGRGIGRSIEAIQTLLQGVLERISDQDFSLNFDVDNYLKTRTLRFQKIALELSELTHSLNRSITIAGLSSFDRRVIHNALSSTEHVETNSVGQGSFRKLSIEPK